MGAHYLYWRRRRWLLWPSATSLANSGLPNPCRGLWPEAWPEAWPEGVKVCCWLMCGGCAMMGGSWRGSPATTMCLQMPSKWAKTPTSIPMQLPGCPTAGAPCTKRALGWDRASQCVRLDRMTLCELHGAPSRCSSLSTEESSGECGRRQLLCGDGEHAVWA